MAQELEPLPWSAALLERFRFATPSSFRLLEARGLFRWSEESRSADLTQPGIGDLWFNDMEWYQPDELREFQLEPHQDTGIVPFAHAGNGDYWSWFPPMQTPERVPVLLCPHDCSDTNLYAPDFAAALYRHALDYATDESQEDEERRAMLERYIVELGALWPDPWRRHLEEAGAGLEWSEYEARIQAEFGKRYTDPFQLRCRNEP